MIALRFSIQKGIASRLIRWGTWSPYSHVDLVLDNAWLLGATASEGVAIRNPQRDDATNEAWFGLADGWSRDLADAVVGHAREQLGRPYDWAGVFGWAFRRNWQDQDAWFCSELVAWAFEQAGHPLLRADNAWRLTPRDLRMSPRLTRIDL